MSDMIEKIADSEAEILKVLWAEGKPLTSRQIRDALDEDNSWQRTTVQTLLKRLVDKGVLSLEEDCGKGVNFYRPLITQSEFEASRTTGLLHKVFGGDAKGLVCTLMNQNALSDSDMTELEQFWRERKDRHG